MKLFWPAAWLLLAIEALSAAPGLAQAPPASAPSLAMASRLRWMRFTMISGRVTAASSYAGTNMTASNLDGQRRERVAIQLRGTRQGGSSVATLRYEQSSPDERLEISILDGKQLSIDRARPLEKYALNFRQAPDEPLTLVVETADGQRIRRGDSFWHLYLADPQLVGKHLVPLIEFLHPSWQLVAQATSLEETLFRRARLGDRADRRQWAAWVDDLASPQFARRNAAERQLREQGPVVLPFLEHLDPSRLDAEQAYRLRALVDALSVDSQDSGERVAVWLVEDELVWLALLDREDASKRRTALKQLETLTGHPIAFDVDAVPEVRRAQLEALWAQWAPEKGPIR